MIRTTTRLLKHSRCPTHRCYSSAAPQIQTLQRHHELDEIHVDEFRQQHFVPEIPLRICSPQEPFDAMGNQKLYPAQDKWFVRERLYFRNSSFLHPDNFVPNKDYLSQFAADTILPYELTISPKNETQQKILDSQDEVGQVLASLMARSPDLTFHRFDAPLSLFLRTFDTLPRHRLQGLYIAQAQIPDLPKQLQDDLPTPRIVTEAGKGDIYDKNIWLGLGPTYTPLHKDPNPNFFLQLAGRKTIRMFAPDVGLRIFRDVQEKIGQQASAQIRGEEMMDGPEKSALKFATWSPEARMECFEFTLRPGQAVFMPKGWWHTVKGGRFAVNASVNWWFR